MKLKLEKHVTQEIKGVLENAAAMNTLDGAARYLKEILPTWFVYKGGLHVAVHLWHEGPRYAIITE